MLRNLETVLSAAAATLLTLSAPADLPAAGLEDANRPVGIYNGQGLTPHNPFNFELTRLTDDDFAAGLFAFAADGSAIELFRSLQCDDRGSLTGIVTVDTYDPDGTLRDRTDVPAKGRARIVQRRDIRAVIVPEGPFGPDLQHEVDVTWNSSPLRLVGKAPGAPAFSLQGRSRGSLPHGGSIPSPFGPSRETIPTVLKARADSPVTSQSAKFVSEGAVQLDSGLPPTFSYRADSLRTARNGRRMAATASFASVELIGAGSARLAIASFRESTAPGFAKLSARVGAFRASRTGYVLTTGEAFANAHALSDLSLVDITATFASPAFQTRDRYMLSPEAINWYIGHAIMQDP